MTRLRSLAPLCGLFFVLAFKAVDAEGHMTFVRRVWQAAGQAFIISCNPRKMAGVSVTWSSSVSSSLQNISGLQVSGDVLWFLPVLESHTGTYSCFSRDGNDTWETSFLFTAESDACPSPNREQVTQDTDTLRCFLHPQFNASRAEYTWRKNCEASSEKKSEFLQVNRSSMMVGLHTCIYNFTLGGQNFSTAQTTKLHSMEPSSHRTRPTVISPKNERLAVTLGESFQFTCKVLKGKEDMEETVVYWTSDLIQDLNFSPSSLQENSSDYELSTLLIPKVTAQYLHVNLCCVANHPTGSDTGILLLVPANKLELIVPLVLVSLLVLLVLLVFLFRVELVLLYRDVCSFTTVSSDGKVYDGYVSFLQDRDATSTSAASSFALRSLPEVMEETHGYNLFISGRDDLPGEDVHDVVCERVKQSRRLIIVLTSQTHAPTDHLQAEFERRVGVYNALIQQGLKVVLVQVEDGLGELPESLLYIRRTRGLLRWRLNGTNRRFWKHLRYRFPPSQRPKQRKAWLI